LDCADTEWTDVRRDLANDIHLFAHYFHGRMRQLTDNQAGPGPMILSPREREVLHWAAEGKTARDTARLLRLSESAVKLYGAKAMDKLRARTKAHAVAIALRHGMLG
jgi:LuxR family quorum sensing-dependent transcriptional regulator